MSSNDTNQHAIARQTKAVIRETGARFAGRERGPDQQVRRDSYDVDDARSKVFRKIEDGSRTGGLGWADDLIELAEQYDLTHRKPGERGPLMASGIRVLKVLLRKFLRFDTGQLDPAVRTVAEYTGYTYKTVHAALSRLRAHGFLRWVRRSCRTGRSEGAGPRREQVSNAYYFAIGELPKRVLMHWRALRERRRRRAGNRPPAIATAVAPATPMQPRPSTLAIALASLGSSIAERESQ